MSIDGENKRLKLFQKFAKNFEFVRASIEQNHVFAYPNGQVYTGDIIACPICLEFSTIDALDQQDDNPLTIEHVPPHSLGGKGLVLTCRKCNNGSANTLDVKLLEHTKVKDFYALKPESKIGANIKFEGKSLVKGEIVIGADDVNYIKLIQDKDDPRTLDFKKILQKGIEVTFKRSPQRQAQIAELRTAYLLIFSRLGFPYILNPNLNKIREQILNPDQFIIPELSIVRNMPENEVAAVSIVKEPIELRSLCAGFYTTLEDKKYYTRVNLPLPKQEAGEFYASLVKFQGQGHTLQVAHLTEETDFLTVDANIANIFSMLDYYSNPDNR